MFSFFAASFMWRLAGLFFSIVIYETLRYLVLDKVRQIVLSFKKKPKSTETTDETIK
jgi:hypothetical protein